MDALNKVVLDHLTAGDRLRLAVEARDRMMAQVAAALIYTNPSMRPDTLAVTAKEHVDRLMEARGGY